MRLAHAWVARLTDAALLAKIRESDADESVRAAAAERAAALDALESAGGE